MSMTPNGIGSVAEVLRRRVGESSRSGSGSFATSTGAQHATASTSDRNVASAQVVVREFPARESMPPPLFAFSAEPMLVPAAQAAHDSPTRPDHLVNEATSPSQPPVVSVEFNVFIPQESINVEDVVGLPLPGNLDGIHQGDGREIGEEGTSRVANTIHVYEDPGGNPPYSVTVDAEIGVSHELDGDGNVIEEAQASPDSIRAEVLEVTEDGTIVVELSAETSNPVQVAAPGITYRVQVELHPNGDGSWSVSVHGDHDGFPAYEVLASVEGGPQEVVYGYDPRTYLRDPMALFSSAEVDVSAEARVEPVPRSATEVVAAHTDPSGAIDTVALGADLADMAESQPELGRDYYEDVMAAVPPEQREAVANTFFESLTVESGGSLPGALANRVALAKTPRGLGIILEMGAYAPEQLTRWEIANTFVLHGRDPLYVGDPVWCEAASEYLDLLADYPEAQRYVARAMRPLYSDEREGMESTPEGRSLANKIDQILNG